MAGISEQLYPLEPEGCPVFRESLESLLFPLLAGLRDATAQRYLTSVEHLARGEIRRQVARAVCNLLIPSEPTLAAGIREEPYLLAPEHSPEFREALESLLCPLLAGVLDFIGRSYFQSVLNLTHEEWRRQLVRVTRNALIQSGPTSAENGQPDRLA